MNERERSIARFVDGEMARDELVTFEARLRDDAALRESVADLRGLRGLFVPERGGVAPVAPGPRPSAGFRARVLAAATTGAFAGARDGATGAHDHDHHGHLDVERFARHIVIAAASVIVAVLAAAFGLLNRADSGRLEASPAEMQRTLEALDAKIRGAEVVPEGR